MDAIKVISQLQILVREALYSLLQILKHYKAVEENVDPEVRSRERKMKSSGDDDKRIDQKFISAHLNQ